MTKTKKDNYFEIKFWEDWLYANPLEKNKLVKDLPFIKFLDNTKKLSKKARRTILTMNLNSFFEDLEQAVYQKIAFENRNSIKINQ